MSANIFSDLYASLMGQTINTNNIQTIIWQIVSALSELPPPHQIAQLESPALTGIPTSPSPEQDAIGNQIATAWFIANQLSNNTPIVNGFASPGSSLRIARADHIHGTDISRAPLESPALRGEPQAPTPDTGTRGSRIATMQKFDDEFSSSLTDPGYQAFPSQGGQPGLLMQWGSSAAPLTFISFPVAFNAACLILVGTAYSSLSQYGFHNDARTTSAWLAMGV
jgi:hypothetical protein